MGARPPRSPSMTGSEASRSSPSASGMPTGERPDVALRAAGCALCGRGVRPLDAGAGHDRDGHPPRRRLVGDARRRALAPRRSRVGTTERVSRTPWRRSRPPRRSRDVPTRTSTSSMSGCSTASRVTMRWSPATRARTRCAGWWSRRARGSCRTTPAPRGVRPLVVGAGATSQARARTSPRPCAWWAAARSSAPSARGTRRPAPSATSRSPPSTTSPYRRSRCRRPVRACGPTSPCGVDGYARRKRRRRSEFDTTKTLERAMATPATSGLRYPSAARGRAATL